MTSFRAIARAVAKLCQTPVERLRVSDREVKFTEADLKS